LAHIVQSSVFATFYLLTKQTEALFIATVG